MKKKLILLLAILMLPSFAYAHSGRLDGSGGHRVNKEHKYQGRYILVKESVKYLQSGDILFEEDDYHFHVKPDFNGFLDGIYLPVKTQDVKTTITTNIYISDENVVASKNSNIYHKSTCRYIRNIKEKNIVILEDKEDAIKNGYVLCKRCIEDGGVR